jgi:hypothetical protein
LFRRVRRGLIKRDWEAPKTGCLVQSIPALPHSLGRTRASRSCSSTTRRKAGTSPAAFQVAHGLSTRRARAIYGYRVGEKVILGCWLGWSDGAPHRRELDYGCSVATTAAPPRARPISHAPEPGCQGIRALHPTKPIRIAHCAVAQQCVECLWLWGTKPEKGNLKSQRTNDMTPLPAWVKSEKNILWRLRPHKHELNSGSQYQSQQVAPYPDYSC